MATKSSLTLTVILQKNMRRGIDGKSCNNPPKIRNAPNIIMNINICTNKDKLYNIISLYLFSCYNSYIFFYCAIPVKLPRNSWGYFLTIDFFNFSNMIWKTRNWLRINFTNCMYLPFIKISIFISILKKLLHNFISTYTLSIICMYYKL